MSDDIIKELPDYRKGLNGYVEGFKEPLLEYVYEVADKILPYFVDDDYQDSLAPTIFLDRYSEHNLTDEERYNRAKDLGRFQGSYEEFMERHKDYRKLDASFKDKFLEEEELQDTIKAFGFDVSKFWYLLLFIYDYVEDLTSNAARLCAPEYDSLNAFSASLQNATTIILKNGNKKIYGTSDERAISIIKTAIQYYIRNYNNTVAKDPHNIEILKNMDLKNPIHGFRYVDFSNGDNVATTHKIWKFTEMFKSFLDDKEAVNLPQTNIKVSRDKMLFISRLIYTVGYDGYYGKDKDGKSKYNEARYYREYDSAGNKNRLLFNLLKNYKKEDFPQVTGRYYSC